MVMLQKSLVLYLEFYSTTYHATLLHQVVTLIQQYDYNYVSKTSSLYEHQ